MGPLRHGHSGQVARLVASLLLVGLGAGGAAGQELPQRAPATHLGVKSCSGAPCHGNSAPVGKRVLQNEYATWSRRDPHAGAYAVLLEDRSRRIASNLALGAAAHESALCLDCHADNVPPDRRGEQFALEDGVGCEACHGGAEHWLEPHISGTGSHEEYVKKGLYPTDDPVARAELCVSCHFGNEDKFVTHRIMGAGHPRMSFELDTFTQIQPAHFAVDADYAERGKAAAEAVQVWAIGQAVIAREILDALLDPARSRDGIWPELVLYDCHACHHPMSRQRWSPRQTTGLYGHPGLPRLDDSSFLMLRHALEGVDPAAAASLREGTRRLHRALSAGQGNPKRATKALREIVEKAIPKLAAWDVKEADVRAIARSLIDDGLTGQYRDYAGAEQAVMALQSLVTTLHDLGALEASSLASARTDLDALLELTAHDERYRAGGLNPALRRIAQALR